MIQGITPSLMMINYTSDILLGPIAIIRLGNLMLVVLNLPLIGIWGETPGGKLKILFPSIMMFAAI